MKVLDRYLVRELLTPIVCCCMTLVFLILIADLFDNLDQLLHNKTPVIIIIKYYLSLIPYAFVETIPWATWLGTVFLLINFGMHNEMTAMKAAGLKATTIFKPILFCGFLIGIFTFLVGDRLVPTSFRVANDLREIHIEKKKTESKEKIIKNVTYYSTGNKLFYFRSFTPATNEARDIIALWLDKNEKNTRRKMIAEKGVFQDGKWEFSTVMEYKMDSQGRILGDPRTFPRKSYSEINMTPRELISSSMDSTFLTYRDLKHSIGKLEENGVDVFSEKVDLHYRLASPWQALVMMMTALPILGATRQRKAIAGSVLLCVGLVFVYHVLGAVSVALGKAGKLFPFAGAWAGNMVFAVGSMLSLEKSNY